MGLQNGEFIELEYSGRLKETRELFDTTSAEEAQKAGLTNPRGHYGPVIVCLGHAQLLKGLENHLLGKDIGKTYTVALLPEEAFGKKDTKLLKIVSTNVFLKQGIRPMPGLQVTIDNTLGTIRTVTGGRTIVDFNHPLSGREVEYQITVKRIVTDKKEQLTGLLDAEGHVHDAMITLKENKAEIVTQEMLPEPFMRHLSTKIKETTGLDAAFEVRTKPESTKAL